MAIFKVEKTQNHKHKSFNANILLCRNESIPTHYKSIDWFLYDENICLKLIIFIDLF